LLEAMKIFKIGLARLTKKNKSNTNIICELSMLVGDCDIHGVTKKSFVSYLQNNNLEEVDAFFNNEYLINIRSIFNYFNYVIKLNRPMNSIAILNKYFRYKGLSAINKKGMNSPLFVDNITSNGTSLDDGIFEKKVSIIMTVFDGESLLMCSLHSLFEQTHQDIEVIVVNDASTDLSSVKLLEAKKLYGEKLTIITLQKNYGTYVAKNIALTYAKGDLIAFHDADDWSHPQRIEEHVREHLKDKKTKFSISKLVRITEGGLFFSKHIYPLDRLSMISLMIDRCVLDEIGFFRKQRIGSDSEYFERLKAFTKHRFARVDKVLMFCAHRQHSLTTSPETGVEGFGVSSKRQHHWDRWNRWHKKLKRARKKPYVAFNRGEYEYSINH